MEWAKKLLDRGVKLVGGKERAKVILILAGVFALDGADKGAIGSMAAELESAFQISKSQIGLMLTVSLGMGCLATLPFGALADRINRTRLLSWAVVFWGAAMILSGAATSYLFLLLTRLLLGGVTACAAPAVASLVGDYFFPRERGRIYGYILAGELVGTGIGFLVSGELASWIWRAGFIALGIPAFFLAWVLYRLKEPERGGEGRLQPEGETAEQEKGKEQASRKVQELIEKRSVEPRKKLLFQEDPRRKSLWWTLKYILRIPTNVVLILASALGYFYFAGIQTFGIQYFENRYRVAHSTSIALALLLGLGAVAGVLTSGRLADKLIQRGYLRARVAVSATSYLLVTAFFALSLFIGGLLWGMIFMTLGAAMLGAMNPPLDAARLDIMVPGLWGRAEAVRIFFRRAGEAGAPFAFGYIAQHIFGSSTAQTQGLHDTFLFMLISLGAAGVVGLIGLKTYSRDVATAEENTRRSHEESKKAA